MKNSGIWAGPFKKYKFEKKENWKSPLYQSQAESERGRWFQTRLKNFTHFYFIFSLSRMKEKELMQHLIKGTFCNPGNSE